MNVVVKSEKRRGNSLNNNVKSIEESDDLSSDVSGPGFFMGVDALIGWDNQMSELSRG